MSVIVVTGATGSVGREVVGQLVSAGQKVRAVVRDPSKAASLFPADVELAVGDLSRPNTIADALAGAERMYLLSPLAEQLPRWEADAIDAAIRAGVTHVVKQSNMGAGDAERTTMQRWHRESELHLEGSGMAWTFVRPTGFMSNALTWAGMIKAQHTVYAAGGDGKLAVVDPCDIAAVAVVALTQPGHEGRAYDVTGPQALSAADQTRILADAIGQPINFVGIPDDVAREQMLGHGMPPVIVDALLEFTDLVRSGRAASVSDAVPSLTGRPARSFADWATEHAAVFA